MGVLRNRTEHDLVVRGLSVHTQRVYLYVVTDLARYHRRSPDELSDRDVHRYVRHLIEERRLAWGSLPTMVSGLRFFYWTTLGREPGEFSLPMPKGSRSTSGRLRERLRPRRRSSRSPPRSGPGKDGPSWSHRPAGPDY